MTPTKPTGTFGGEKEIPIRLGVVYNETMNTDRPEVPRPRPPLMRRRAFLVKYSYTFGL